MYGGINVSRVTVFAFTGDCFPRGFRSCNIGWKNVLQQVQKTRSNNTYVHKVLPAVS